MAKKITVQELNKENFKEFGNIIAADTKPRDGGDEGFDFWERLGVFQGIDKISVNVLRAKKRDLVIDKLEVHKDTPEAIIPLDGAEVVLVVGPSGPFDESKVKAFKIGNGKGVIINHGVRHFIPYPIHNHNVDCLIVFKDATGANDLIFDQLSEPHQILV
jgi:ureidoglycolate hydrolase